MKIFSGSSNKPLAGKIAKLLKKELSQLEIHIFPDQEKRVRVLEKVLGEDAVIVQSTSTDADKNYIELFFIADALRRSGVKTIIVVIPYLGYQRQDHLFREGEAVSIDVIVKILKVVGVDKVITFDLHSTRIPEIFNIRIVHLSALSIFAEKIKEDHLDGDDTVLVSPDKGGIRRIKILSEMLGNMPYAVIEKNRDLATGKVTMDGIDGEVEENAIIVDDMISTGSTIVTAANLLKNKGAKNIYVFATHAVFSKDAPKILQNSSVSSVYVTDTIFVPEEKQFPKLEILSISEMIAKTLKI